MKRILLATLLLALSFPMMGQDTIQQEERVMPKDSLPDLWIITVDLTGSMKGDEHGHNINYPKIPKRFDEIVERNGGDKNRDSFVLLSSGMTYAELRCSDEGFANAFKLCYAEKDFTSILIKRITEYSTYDKVYGKIASICNNSNNFNYNRSFASIARPLSIHYLVTNQFDFSKYNRIYHIQITDNGDTNDQWGIEYHFLRVHYEKHFLEVKRILPTIACSKFDFISKHTGSFDEIDMIVDGEPRRNEEPLYVFLTQYKTYQESFPEIRQLDSLLKVSDFHDNCFVLTMKPGNDSVKFVYVESCQVNDSTVVLGQYLYPKDSLLVEYDRTWGKSFQNRIAVNGSYQEEYKDRILGLRYRTVNIADGAIAGFFVSAETRAKGIRYLQEILAFLLALFIIIFIRRNRFVLCLFVNGKRIRIRRKALNKLRDKTTILSIFCKDDQIRQAYSYKGKGISIDYDDETKQGSKELFIHSLRKLTMFGSIPNHRRKWYHVYEYNNVTDTILIQWSETKRLLVNVEDYRMKHQKFNTNPLQESNLRMLARYYEYNSDRIESARNNVVMTVFSGPANKPGVAYSNYAALNIFDLSSRDSATRIFLRYSLIREIQEDVIEVYEELIEKAREVLKSEKQRKGFVEKRPYRDDSHRGSCIEVDVSKMTSYLYACQDKKKKLAYSPFVDGKLDLHCKKVPVFRGAFELADATMKKGALGKRYALTSDSTRTDLVFFEDCKVELLNSPKLDFAFGQKVSNTLDSQDGEYYVC